MFRLPEKSLCLVVPLQTDEKPYTANIGPKDVLIDCIVYDMELLKKVQSSIKKDARQFSLEKVRAEHRKMSKLLEEKEMPPFGKAGYAKDDIAKGSYIVYSGYAMERVVGNLLPHAEQAYFMAGADDESILFDGKYIEGKSKYLQHLPAHQAWMSEINCQTENVLARLMHIPIDLENTKFLLPITILSAPQNINKGALVGYDYGNLYWHILNITSSYFSKDNQPIPLYQFKLINASDEIFQILCDKTSFEELHQKGCSFIGSEFFVIPQAVRPQLNQAAEEKAQGTVKVEPDYIASFEMTEDTITGNSNHHEVLIINLSHQASQDFRNKKIPADRDMIYFTLGVDPQPQLVTLILSVKKLTSATLEQLVSLQKFLKAYAKDSDCMSIRHNDKKVLCELKVPASQDLNQAPSNANNANTFFSHSVSTAVTVPMEDISQSVSSALLNSGPG